MNVISAKKVCYATADLGFVIDSSSSITDPSYCKSNTCWDDEMTCTEDIATRYF